jgi:carbamoyltransferase
MRILGLSAFYHDSAAALVEDGRIIAAAQEERFSRKKHDSGFPHNATQYCLEAGATRLAGIDRVVFYDKPFLKFERLLETYLAFAPAGFKSFKMAVPLWLREKLFQKQLLRDELRKFSRDFPWEEKLLFTEHHQSHAASAFFPSPFSEAAILTMDGVGEWATTSVAFGCGNQITMLKELHFPHSLGLLYSAFTYYLGFKVNSGEYKVMGLAPYGEPKFADLILDCLIDLRPDGTFWLDQSYFDYCTGLRMTNEKFDRLFGAPPRRPEEPLTSRHMDLAASIQSVTDEIVLRLTRSLAAQSDAENLCLAGGVALNCVANGKIVRDGKFKRVWIQPAAGDAGGAIGAALAAYHIYSDKPRDVPPKPDGMNGAYLGPAFGDDESASRLAAAGARFTRLDDATLIDRAATDLADGRVLGWFQGRMEFGPRALGNRSIIADGRRPEMQAQLNLKIKYRESFRPFAPAVLRSDVADWFELDCDSPYMLLVANVVSRRRRSLTAEQQALFGIEKLNISRSDIPAATHVDYSARIQTVHAETNPRFHGLLSAFKAVTGCPVLVNTSLNVRGEPIVNTPEDAFRCFMGTEIDRLAVGNLYLIKADQDPSLKRDYKGTFELD